MDLIAGGLVTSRVMGLTKVNAFGGWDKNIFFRGLLKTRIINLSTFWNKDGLQWRGSKTVFMLKFILLNFVPVFFFFLKKNVLSSKMVSVLQYCEFVLFWRLRILSQWKATIYIDPIGKSKLCTEIRDPRLTWLSWRKWMLIWEQGNRACELYLQFV